MKAVSIKEFKNYSSSRKVSPYSTIAHDVIVKFIDSGDDVAEIEESDFNDQFKFDVVKDRNKATSYLRNALRKAEFRKSGLCIKQRGARIFIGKSAVLDPDFETNTWRR